MPFLDQISKYLYFVFAVLLLIMMKNWQKKRIQKLSPAKKNLISDKTLEKLQKLDQELFRLEQEKGFTSFNNQQKAVYCVSDLIREVNNGGFNQYFFNTAGNYWLETQKALRNIKAKQTLKIFNQSLTVFPQKTPPSNRLARQKIIAKFSNQQNENLEKTDQLFYRNLENLTKLVMAYYDQQD